MIKKGVINMTTVIIIDPQPLLQLVAAKSVFSLLAAIIAARIEDAPTISLDELDELYPDEV